MIKSLKKAAIPLLTAMSLTVCAAGMNTNAQNLNSLSGTSFGTFCSHRGRNADEVGYCLHCDVCICANF